MRQHFDDGTCSRLRKKADDPVFTGDKTEAPVYQANLDAIKSSAYASADNLDLEPGPFRNRKGSSTPYWNQVKAGVEQAATDLNTALGYSGNDKRKYYTVHRTRMIISISR